MSDFVWYLLYVANANYRVLRNRQQANIYRKNFKYSTEQRVKITN